MTTQARNELACQAAKEKNMTAKIWEGGDETRVYLARTNAARTEAGYIRFFSKEGKGFSRLVITAKGSGSRTCEFEAEAVYAHYQALRAAAK